MGIVRVFPRRTKATPIDALAFVGNPPLYGLKLQPGDEIHVSCTFTWDIKKAERLAREWAFIYQQATVKVGGPAYGNRGGDFEPGLYVKPGYVITSRGCPNRCPMCLVPQREGPLRTLPIRDGFDVLDNNLLACPPEHIAAVFAMLRRQKERPKFTGGLEAARATREVLTELATTHPIAVFFAYDRPAEKPHVERAVREYIEVAGIRPSSARAIIGVYILIGYDGDTIEAAEERIAFVRSTGARAFPMVFRDSQYSKMSAEWRDLSGGILAFGGR